MSCATGWWAAIASAAVLALTLSPSPGRASDAAVLDPLYDRIAADLIAGQPLRIEIHVALCDNASQGIVPVKNGRICDGDQPDHNLYWSTRGGLKRYLKDAGWRRLGGVAGVSEPVIDSGVWRKRLRAGGGLAARGVGPVFEVEVRALAYRGRRIADAFGAYLEASHGTGDAHVVGYIGHDYALDVARPESLLPRRSVHAPPVGPGPKVRGTFALSCLGQQWIRPLLTGAPAYALLLNTQLTYPGAWSVGGLVEGLAAGLGPSAIRLRAADAFARGKGRPAKSTRRAFSHGPVPDRPGD